MKSDVTWCDMGEFKCDTPHSVAVREGHAKIAEYLVNHMGESSASGNVSQKTISTIFGDEAEADVTRRSLFMDNSYAAEVKSARRCTYCGNDDDPVTLIERTSRDALKSVYLSMHARTLTLLTEAEGEERKRRAEDFLFFEKTVFTFLDSLPQSRKSSLHDMRKDSKSRITYLGKDCTHIAYGMGDSDAGHFIDFARETTADIFDSFESLLDEGTEEDVMMFLKSFPMEEVSQVLFFILNLSHLISGFPLDNPSGIRQELAPPYLLSGKGVIPSPTHTHTHTHARTHKFHTICFSFSLS